jgi:hypothetical protein
MGSWTFRRLVLQGLKRASIYTAYRLRGAGAPLFHLTAYLCIPVTLRLRWTILYIGFSPADEGGRRLLLFVRAKDYPMTYLDVVFRYGAAPGENELRAIDGMREVYGVRRVQFNERERTVRVEFDASRLKADAVAKLLRQAGVDVRERLTLA